MYLQLSQMGFVWRQQLLWKTAAAAAKSGGWLMQIQRLAACGIPAPIIPGRGRKKLGWNGTPLDVSPVIYPAIHKIQISPIRASLALGNPVPVVNNTLQPFCSNRPMYICACETRRRDAWCPWRAPWMTSNWWGFRRWKRQEPWSRSGSTGAASSPARLSAVFHI